MATRIEKTDLARDALYDKVNTMIDEVNTKIDNKDSLPSQTGNGGKFLTTDGTNASWGTVKQIEIKQNLTNPSADTVPSTKAVKDESIRITTLMNTKVSNCITYIPQDIKLELNNGTLTLKAGSKVYNGNGLILTTDSDKTLYQTYDDTSNMLLILKLNNNSLQTGISGETVSSLPSPTTSYKVFYNTIDDKCYYDDGQMSECSLPIALVSRTTSGFSSIDQVFNGFGYIGSTIFALPGVKGLIPNGRNADGSLKSIEVVQNSVKIMTMPSRMAGKSHCPLQIFSNNELGGIYVDNNKWGVIATLKDLPRDKVYSAYYCLEDNFLHYFNNTGVESTNKSLFAATFAVGDDNKITSFTPKTVFHALDYNDKSTISGWSMPSSRYIDLTLGASGRAYTAPANGYFSWYCYRNNKGYIFVQSSASLLPNRVANASNDIAGFIPVKKGDIVLVEYANLTFNRLRFIFAEGEK